MATKLRTPGVYIEEKNAFPGSVVEVETAIPAFIGYTEIATRNGKSLLNKPTRVTSLKEYEELFGGAFNPQFTIGSKSTDPKKPDKYLFTINGEEQAISYVKDHQLLLYNCMRFFFANGGSTCYIVSVGNYTDNKAVTVDKDAIEKGLLTLEKEQEPTMIVIPEAVLKGKDSYNIYRQALAHCAKMQSRVTIMDIYNGIESRVDKDNNDVIVQFRELIGSDYLSYGAAYYPWLHTSIATEKDVTFKNLKVSPGALVGLFKEGPALEVIKDYQAGMFSDIHGLNSNDKKVSGPAKEEQKRKLAEFENLPPEKKKVIQDAYDTKFHQSLIATSPTYENLMKELRFIINTLPPSAAMAGVYTKVDNDRGVWKAPANVSMNEVDRPTMNITHEDQETLNVDAISGKSINAIRTFKGVGTTVWGGRTLDGNSLDWRYINVRRTIIMLEQSIKLALRAYVFEPNDANTWVTVKSMIVNYLTQKWKDGALVGASPEDAFDVQIGLGSTMTAVDILEGKMLISVKLAIVRPAEFIVVTFQQQMQKS